MNNNKKFLLTIILSSTLVIGLVIAVLLLITKSANGYTFAEKNYMSSNASKVIDISVDSNMSAFSENGEGVAYDFIKALEEDTKLSFNVLVNTSAEYKITNKNEPSKSDLLLYDDHYVLISTKTNPVANLEDVSSQPIGVLSSDLEYVSNYLKDYNFSFKEYKTTDDLKKDMNNTIIYALVPLQKYSSFITSSRYYVVKHIEGLHNYFVITLSTSNSTLNSIIAKFNKNWSEDLDNSLNEHLVNIFYKINSVTEIEKEKVSRDDLIVGYIENMPYEGKAKNNFSGITHEFLERFAKMTGASYKYIKYKNKEEMINALAKNKIDIASNYQSIINENYGEISTLYNTNFAVITSVNSKLVVDDLKTIKGKTIKMVNSNIVSYIENYGATIKLYETFDELIDSLNDNDIAVIEKFVYDFYKNNRLSNYVIKYLGKTPTSKSFLVRKDETTLYNLFSYFMSIYGNKETENEGLKSAIVASRRSLILEFIINNLFYIILLAIASLFFTFKVKRRVKVTKKIKKEDKLMYLDVMTNLKNRNFLNDNLEYWEANKIYPQTIVIVDLNDISEINDTKGHEEGDKQIVAAAKVLIGTQRENSEIIRTNGNEFLIYLVGYEEKAVLIYINKLMKEFKNLPYNYGASIGYHMITSESVSIDDAINEALKKMRENKENQ